MCQHRHRDPETVAYNREVADSGTFEVVVRRDGEKIGTLDQTFYNEYDATVAAKNNEIPDVGISTDVNDITDTE